ncbi:hypothetical protein RRG08_050299 [Elysia crispata]|uniref:Uncharacterized protein n=1 Tax=Elysia crispata TaxID=231223 RepID=A0AAE0ZZR9_9GAST|nr:hypothetical protein RRG08_050299 [Elysia crispata]
MRNIRVVSMADRQEVFSGCGRSKTSFCKLCRRAGGMLASLVIYVYFSMSTKLSDRYLSLAPRIYLASPEPIHNPSTRPSTAGLSRFLNHVRFLLELSSKLTPDPDTAFERSEGFLALTRKPPCPQRHGLRVQRPLHDLMSSDINAHTQTTTRDAAATHTAQTCTQACLHSALYDIPSQGRY